MQEFSISNQVVRVSVGKGIPTDLVDKVIFLLTTGRVQFASDLERQHFQGIDLTEMDSIEKTGTHGEYELQISMRTFQFKLQANGILVTGTGTINI